MTGKLASVWQMVYQLIDHMTYLMCAGYLQAVVHVLHVCTCIIWEVVSFSAVIWVVLQVVPCL